MRLPSCQLLYPEAKGMGLEPIIVAGFAARPLCLLSYPCVSRSLPEKPSAKLSLVLTSRDASFVAPPFGVVYTLGRGGGPVTTTGFPRP